MGVKFEIHDKPCLNHIHVCCVILLLLCCWGCGDPPNSVMEMVLPDKDMPPAEEPTVTMEEEQPTVTAEEEPPPPTVMEEEPPPPITKMPDLGLVMEMEAIMASEGEVHSPIPDDVYKQLWGHWTKAGSAAPRKFYTKFIAADGIAIVGSDNVDDAFFQMARHIVLVMTSKLPRLREALSADQVGGITGDEVPFRLVLTNRKERDVLNMPENLNTNLGTTALWLGSFRGYLARADVEILGEPTMNQNFWGHQFIMHEMAHAIHEAIGSRNLVPNFNERLGTSFDREMEKVQLRWDVDGNPYLPYTLPDGTRVGWEDLPEWDRPAYCMANGNSHDNGSEFWAWYVEDRWFDFMFNPISRAREPSWNPLEEDRERCPNLTGITEEVFPPFSLHFAVETRGYTLANGNVLRRN